MQKPGGLLSVEAQVAYLAAKGVGFALMDEAAAMEYLQYHNNYFKLTAYRKNYQKHPGGAKAGQYVRLEFAHLVDLATIDMEWRYQIMQMALDIEHHAKLQILRLLEAEGADAYDIVAAYRAALSENDRRILDDELQRNRGNVYCGEIRAAAAGVGVFGAGVVWQAAVVLSFRGGDVSPAGDEEHVLLPAGLQNPAQCGGAQQLSAERSHGRRCAAGEC